jgi:ABC-2 type transport system permease protein
VALACGFVIGFRFHRGSLYAAAFCLLALLTGLALALLGDTLGTRSRDPAATAQWLLLPQLIFGFLSVGIQPLQRFPGWLQPIVENQPISRLVYALQALAGDSGDKVAPVTWSVIWPALAWLAGIMAVTVPWAVAVYRRRS